MAELTKRYLVHRPELPDDGWRDLARTYVVGKDVDWKDSKLTLAFDGNRVDLLPAAGGKGGKLAVRVDGKRPSEFPGAYRIIRPQPGPWSPLTVTRIDHDKPLVVEDWTLKVTAADPAKKLWSYEVTGSKTGPDGDGSSAAAFVSNSGRVKIDPAAFFGEGKGAKPGYEIRWKVLPMFADDYAPPADADPAKENAATVVQGIPNDRHTLELTTADAGSPPAVAAVRVYRPPVK